MSGLTDETPLELIKFLCGSDVRHETLVVLQEESQREKLISMGFESSTLTGNIQDFEDRGLIVEPEQGTYELTSLGEYVSKEYFNFIDKLETVTETAHLRPFLNQVDDWESELCDADYLKNSDISMEREIGGNQAIHEYNKLIEDSTSIREVIHRSITPNSFIEWLDGEENDLEIIMPREMAEQYEEIPVAYRKWRNLHDNGADYLISDREIPFTLTIFNDTGVGIFPSKTDEPDIFLYTEQEEVLEWAEAMYGDLREDAELTDPYQF